MAQGGRLTVVGIAGGAVEWSFFTTPWEATITNTYWGSIQDPCMRSWTWAKRQPVDEMQHEGGDGRLIVVPARTPAQAPPTPTHRREADAARAVEPIARTSTLTCDNQGRQPVTLTEFAQPAIPPATLMAWVSAGGDCGGGPGRAPPWLARTASENRSHHA